MAPVELAVAGGQERLRSGLIETPPECNALVHKRWQLSEAEASSTATRLVVADVREIHGGADSSMNICVLVPVISMVLNLA